MINLSCDKCGSDLIFDDVSTLKSYVDEEYHYRLFMDGVLDETTIQNYLIYVCSKCGEIHKMNHKEWEDRYRKEIALAVMNIKKREAFRNLNPSAINPDNGIEFCGQCTGYGEDGYCLKDIIKQCSLRKR
jgi:hypothetical protein